jgi:hypothetical protein
MHGDSMGFLNHLQQAVERLRHGGGVGRERQQQLLLLEIVPQPRHPSRHHADLLLACVLVCVRPVVAELGSQQPQKLRHLRRKQQRPREACWSSERAHSSVERDRQVFSLTAVWPTAWPATADRISPTPATGTRRVSVSRSLSCHLVQAECSGRPSRPTRRRCVSIFLDKNRRYTGKSQSKQPPKRTQRTPHRAASGRPPRARAGPPAPARAGSCALLSRRA